MVARAITALQQKKGASSDAPNFPSRGISI
jgi:hypothetical protein